jgi:bifunctional ADP-heptose synthase (sugar kinase/adenylyltransferase)
MFEEETPELLIKLVRPDVLVKGADYVISEIVGADFVKSYGGQVKRITLAKGRSTTDIIEKIKKLY